jgi:outer membrane lipoprotein-sorting protein
MNPANPDEYRLNSAVLLITGEALDNSAIQRVKQQALRLDTPNQRPVAMTPVAAAGRFKSPWLTLGSVAASVAATLVLGVWFVANSASTAFAQVVEHVMLIRNVQFVTRMQTHNDPANAVTVMIQNEVFRFEQGPEQHRFVSILNSATQEILYLDPSQKLAQHSRKHTINSTTMVNPIAELAAAKGKSIRSLGKDRIAGREVEVYRVKGLSILGEVPEAEMTLWADTVTHLPVKIELQDTDPKHKMSLTFDEFQWNVSFADELFSMTVPDGYESGIIVKDPSDSENKRPEPEYTQDFADGVLFSGRVPGRLEVDHERGTVTALLRDPEKLQGTMNRPPHELRQWDASTGEQRWVQSVGGAGDFAICSSMDLLGTVQGQEIQLRQLSTGTIVRAWESDNVLGMVAISHDGTRLAHGYTHWSHPPRSSPPSGGVEIWNTETGRLELHIKDIDRVDYLEFSPTSDVLVVCSAEWKTKLYDAATGVLAYSMNSGSRAAFSPDGTLLATVSSQLSSNKTQRRVDLVDRASMKTVRSMISSEGKTNSWLLSLAFSQDGHQLAASDWNGSVTVWDVTTGDVAWDIDPIPNGVHSVRFVNPNQLAIGCEDGTLRFHTLVK